MRRLAGFLLTLTLAAETAMGSAACAAVDFQKAGDEATDLLSHYLQIDTTNPPGNEQAGAEFLADVLKRNGIDAQILVTAPNRACVYARMKGNGKKRPIVLLSHIDVVPAEAKDWKYPPFSGSIHDGELWGRGALDMKNLGIMELEAMLMLKRQNAVLDRDIIFLATPDEEMGADYGARWFKEHHPELVKDAEFLINEGFMIEADSSLKPLYWGVDVAEKSVLWLKITAKGNAGHASMPIADSAPNRLVRALTRLVDSPVHFTIQPVVQQYFRDIAPLAPAELQAAYKDLSIAEKDAHLKDLMMHQIQKSAMLMNTVSLTVLKAGYKTNVIPAEASAELDCRLLPDEKPEDFTAEIKRRLGDPTLEVTRLDWQKAGPSPADSEFFHVIEKVAAMEKPAVPVVPVVVNWFTDSHHFRELGIHSYGFEPVETDAEHLATVHGKNERIPVDVLHKGVRRTYEIVRLLCTSQ